MTLCALVFRPAAMIHLVGTNSCIQRILASVATIPAVSGIASHSVALSSEFEQYTVLVKLIAIDGINEFLNFIFFFRP